MTRFSDVPLNHPFYDDIEWAAENGITFGVGGGKFAPDQPTSRAQMVAFLHRLANLLESEPGPEPDPEPDPEPEPEPDPEPDPQPEPEPDPTSWNPLSRPYSADSPWNTPLPANPQVHSRSAEWINRIAFVSIDPTQYSYPVYFANESAPVWTITCTGAAKVYKGTSASDAPNKRFTVRLPSDFTVSAGSDGQIIAVDLTNGDELDLWQVRNVNRTARTATASNGSLLVGGMYGKGTTHPTVYASRGAGVPYYAGLIRPHEIAAGRIPHALVVGCNSVGPQHVYPATKSDGPTNGGIPEGSRIFLDPSVNLDQVRDSQNRALTATGKIVARALQEFGAYVIDYAGNTGKIYAEYEATAHWNGSLPNSVVNRIPSNLLRVVA